MTTTTCVVPTPTPTPAPTPTPTDPSDPFSSGKALVKYLQLDDDTRDKLHPGFAAFNVSVCKLRLLLDGVDRLLQEAVIYAAWKEGRLSDEQIL